MQGFTKYYLIFQFIIAPNYLLEFIQVPNTP